MVDRIKSKNQFASATLIKTFFRIEMRCYVCCVHSI